MEFRPIFDGMKRGRETARPRSLSPLSLAFALLVLAAPHSILAGDRDELPMNVVLIVADDLGWNDTTLYGGTELYETPHVQRLAARGMTFSRHYTTSPLCSPTRASILTGLSPARTGITSPTCHLPKVQLHAATTPTGPPNVMATTPQSATRLDTEHYTLGEAFRDAGYATGHFGKWHLGPRPYSPLEHGFDVDVPHWAGPGPAGSYVAPWKFVDFDPQTPNEHIEDRMAQEAAAFMEKNRNEPFFLNYWMFSVHAPFDAKPKLIEKYRERIDPKSPQRCPTYAAMVESMDDAIGTLLDTLDRLKLAERTIIVFTSDNGGNMYNTVEGERPTSNAPLRGGKATMYDGGIRVPLVVVWPPVVKPKSTSTQLVSSADFFPTLLEMTGVKPKQPVAFDGVSVTPALRGKVLERNAVFAYFPHSPPVPEWIPPSAAVVEGDWKLIRIFHGGGQQNHRWKLYDLREDPGERQNMAADHPQRVARMDALIESHLQACSAIRPLPNPKFDAKKYDASREGKPAQRHGGNGNSPKSPALSPAVAGWRGSRHAKLSTKASHLHIRSTGGDPYLVHRLPKPLPAGEFQGSIRLSVATGGEAQWFWAERDVAPAFHRDRSLSFALQHDGEMHEHQFQFKAKRNVLQVRLDPGRAAGDVRIESVTLRQQGKIVWSWPGQSR